MQSEKHAVCHFCLTSRECPFEYVEAVTTEVLSFVGLELGLDISERPVTCRICSDNLQKCFDFKTICIYTENYINSFRDDRNNVDLDLWEIYLSKNADKDIALFKCHTVCRLCMELTEAGRYMSLNEDAKDGISTKAILERYISEINLDTIKNPVICISCNESLYSYYNFVKNCLSMDSRIKWCEVEEKKNKPREESESLLQFPVENVSNYGNSNAEIDMPNNCNENELHDEVKLELGNLAQRACQQLHIKHELNEHDGVKVKKLSDIVERYHENGENCGTAIKCEDPVETENGGINIKHEEIDIKTEEKDPAGFRFQDDMLTLNDASTQVVHQCKICKFEAKSKRGLKEHLLVHRNSAEVPIYSCDICAYQPKQKYYLKRHMLTHKNASELRMYSCKICTFQAKRKDYLGRHMLTHKDASELKIFSCEICMFQTKQKHCLKRHMLTHKDASEITMYSCEICKFQAKCRDNLKRHMLTHKDAFEVTMYSCEKCTFQTKHKRYLKQHMFLHKDDSEVRTYSCAICTFQTKQKCYLRKHLLTHKDASELTMYSCETCTFQAKSKDYLRRHTLTHKDKDASEVTMYSCGICKFQTKQKGYLRIHLLTHKDTSEVTMYSCKICTYQTKRKGDVRQHMLLHNDATETTMYSCAKCAYQTKRKYHLRKHILTHKVEAEVC